MAIVTAPSLQEISDVLWDWNVTFGQHHPNRPLHDKIVAWVEALNSLDDASKIRMAVDTAMSCGPLEGLLAISTAHISAETGKALTLDELPVTVYPHAIHGWQVFVPIGEASDWNAIHDDHEAGDLPDDLFNAMVYARERGCCWLLLDGDSSPVKELLVFEW